LAHLLDDMGRADEALAVFADLVARRPNDRRHLTCYGVCLREHGRREAGEMLARAESVVREAVRLRPEDARARSSLGKVLGEQGKDEAIEAYREAVRLEPDQAGHHGGLGHALAIQQTPAKAIAAYPEAIAELRTAIRLDPNDFASYVNLGSVLGRLGRNDEATAAARDAVRVRPDHAYAHASLACCLRTQGKLEEAVAENREAIRLQPDNRLARCNLGALLADLGKIDEGIEAYREALRVMPYFFSAQRELPLLLRRKGDFTGSLAEFRKFQEQVLNRPFWSVSSSKRFWSDLSTKWVEETERMVKLAPRLPGVLKGDDRPRDNAERLVFVQMCLETKRYATAARLYAEALESDPRLVRDRQAWHRLEAARTAALAATGRGEDEPSVDDGQKGRLRRQALVWLKAELADAVAAGPAQTRLGEASYTRLEEAYYQLLWKWRGDGQLACVRELEALARLPLTERRQWEAFWAEVEDMIKRAEAMIKRAPASASQSRDSHAEDGDIK
jgi:tetratricopeptide (TPR) repeat protein